MKKVWAEFEVPDEIEVEDVALALEIRFKAEGNTATVWDLNARAPWHRDAAAIFTEGSEAPGYAKLVFDLSGAAGGSAIAQMIVEAHNRDAGFPA